MPSRCCAPRCTNSSEKGYCCTVFSQDPKLKQQWIDAIGIPNWESPKSVRLCEVHFHLSALYCVGNKKFIKKNAIPSFFCKCDIAHNQEHKVMKEKKFSTIENIISEHNYSLRSLRYKNHIKNYQVKLEKERKLRHFIHNIVNCCGKKSPVDIKMFKKSPNKRKSAKEGNVEVKQIYETMEVKLNNMKYENEVLKKEIHCLQDDLIHIMSFRFPTH